MKPKDLWGEIVIIYPVQALGRSRLILMWPNTTDSAIPVTSEWLRLLVMESSF
ncbi:MAG TPA: hypothetical protein H9796_04865 [Candidatus Butyricimonas faecavium]|nr:hypothetical protein [Candidatus Butyricimonas faecavium]